MRAIIRLAALTVALFGARYMLNDFKSGMALLIFGGSLWVKIK